MDKKVNLISWLTEMFKEFISESTTKPQYEIVDVFECKKSGYIKAMIKLSERHVIEKNISDIVISNDLIQGMDRKTIRTLTYMATIEKMKPDHSIVVQYMGNEVDEYILEIKSSKTHSRIKKTATEISEDKDLLSKFDPIEANRIGYLAGIRETVNEFKMLKSRKSN